MFWNLLVNTNTLVPSKSDLEQILTRPEAQQRLVWLVSTGFELLMGCKVLRLYLVVIRYGGRRVILR